MLGVVTLWELNFCHNSQFHELSFYSKLSPEDRRDFPLKIQMKMSGEKKEERWKTRVPVKVPLTEINAHLKCPVCFGYLIDATAIVECQHTCESP